MTLEGNWEMREGGEREGRDGGVERGEGERVGETGRE